MPRKTKRDDKRIRRALKKATPPKPKPPLECANRMINIAIAAAVEHCRKRNINHPVLNPLEEQGGET